jgi:large subunit ribosomal protein L9
VSEAGFTVIRGQIVLDKAIKTLGLYKLRVVLHPEVSVQVTVNVAQSPEEAEMQAKGVDPIKLAQEAAAREAAAAAEAATGESEEEPPKAEEPSQAPDANRRGASGSRRRPRSE